MRKIKEVLRLRYEAGLGHRQIARGCSLGLGTVHDYLRRAEAAGVKWPLPEGWDDDRLESTLFGRSHKPEPMRPLPDFASIHQQLQQHSHLTQQLVWEEYRQAHPDGYGYSRYVAAVLMLPLACRHYACSAFDGTHRNINRSPAGAIGLSGTPSTKANAYDGVQSQAST